jgi:hypothetical protein
MLPTSKRNIEIWARFFYFYLPISYILYTFAAVITIRI